MTLYAQLLHSIDLVIRFLGEHPAFVLLWATVIACALIVVALIVELVKTIRQGRREDRERAELRKRQSLAAASQLPRTWPDRGPKGISNKFPRAS